MGGWKDVEGSGLGGFIGTASRELCLKGAGGALGMMVFSRANEGCLEGEDWFGALRLAGEMHGLRGDFDLADVDCWGRRAGMSWACWTEGNGGIWEGEGGGRGYENEGADWDLADKVSRRGAMLDADLTDLIACGGRLVCLDVVEPARTFPPSPILPPLSNRPWLSGPSVLALSPILPLPDDALSTLLTRENVRLAFSRALSSLCLFLLASTSDRSFCKLQHGSPSTAASDTSGLLGEEPPLPVRSEGVFRFVRGRLWESRQEGKTTQGEVVMEVEGVMAEETEETESVEEEESLCRGRLEEFDM